MKSKSRWEKRKASIAYNFLVRMEEDSFKRFIKYVENERLLRAVYKPAKHIKTSSRLLEFFSR